jgi:hypothetical protein
MGRRHVEPEGRAANLARQQARATAKPRKTRAARDRKINEAEAAHEPARKHQDRTTGVIERKLAESER